MSRFEKDSQELLLHIGGKENIKAVTHCVTRMRFVLIDDSKADVEAIEKIREVKGTFTQAGQFQVIIGNAVPEFYADFIKVSGISGVNKDAVKAEAKGKQTAIQQIMTNIAEIFSPLIPALVCGGLILGFRNVIGDIPMFDNGTKTLVEMSTFWSGVNSFLWLIGEAIFHFLPVGITWSITKKMGGTQILGIILGLCLVSPQLLNAYAVAGTPVGEIPVWDFGFAQVQMIGYQAQVIPAILAGFTLVYLERFFTKIIPDVLHIVVVPFLALVPAVLLAHTILGPIGWWLGNQVSQIVWAGLTSPLKWLFATVFGFVYAPLVITGLHHMTNAIDLQLMSAFGGTLLWPMIALSNIAQGSAVMGMIALQRKNQEANQVSIPAAISCYLGVTEPAMFGVNLKYRFPFLAGMIGSAIAATISVGFGVMANSIGVGGLPGFLAIQSQFIVPFLLAMAVALVVPFVITYLVGLKQLTPEQRNGTVEGGSPVDFGAMVNAEMQDTFDFVSPMTGNVIALEDVADQTFAQKMMGDGFAVEMTKGNVVAPFSGEVTMVFPTKHAIGLVNKEGVEVLLHIGMDTVELNGEGFELKVQQGDIVTQGDLLVVVDIDYVKEQGKSVVSPVIFTNGAPIKMVETKTIKANEEILQFV